MPENKKNKVNQKSILIIILIIDLLVIFSWLIKFWYIPNFLDIDILCPEYELNINESLPIRIPSSWMKGSIDKPIIYLYPEEKTNVKVTLNYEWNLFAVYPDYNYEIKWWEVEALPNGNLINIIDNKEYSYLFWEWTPNEKIDWQIDSWFVVKWSDSKDFLQNILPQIWLTPKEYNEFIVYWYPLIQNNPYNLIHFSWKQYTDMAPLKTDPIFDSLLRVFMVVKPLNGKIDIEEQKIKSFERKWFTVVEWGGTIIE